MIYSISDIFFTQNFHISCSDIYIYHLWYIVYQRWNRSGLTGTGRDFERQFDRSRSELPVDQSRYIPQIITTGSMCTNFSVWNTNHKFQRLNLSIETSYRDLDQSSLRPVRFRSVDRLTGWSLFRPVDRPVGSSHEILDRFHLWCIYHYKIYDKYITSIQVIWYCLIYLDLKINIAYDTYHISWYI